MTLAEQLMRAQLHWPTFDVGHSFLARLNSGVLEVGELEAGEVDSIVRLVNSRLDFSAGVFLSRSESI